MTREEVAAMIAAALAPIEARLAAIEAHLADDLTGDALARAIGEAARRALAKETAYAESH